MGLFGKKKIPDGVKVVFYEGELMGFQCNFPCQILLTTDLLRITKVNPYVEVTISRERIVSIDVFSELEYMAKHKGTNAQTTKERNIAKSYYVINYVSKDGCLKHLDFWGTSHEALKMMRMREEILKDKKTTTYEL